MVSWKSRLLKALLAFRDHRLSPLLEEVTKGQPALPEDSRILEQLAHQPERAQSMLARIVREIDAKLPGYFRPEKETGVWKWLESGGSLPLEYSIGPEHPLPWPPTGRIEHVLTDVAGTHSMFDLKTQTLHTGSGSNPSARSVLSALYMSGTLGQEVVDLNRAALLHVATGQLRKLMYALEATRSDTATVGIAQDSVTEPELSMLSTVLAF